MASPISEEYRRNVRPKLDLISKLQQVLEQSSDRDDIRLPRIAVVGTQSSGKSSVLERLSGVRLPRGQDLCTRVPLTLCIKGEAQSKQSIAYGKKDYAIANNGVEEEVRKATSKLVGDNQTIENKPITLRISGPSLPDLMLVDLPGIIYTAKGNQPQDIDVQVKSLINRYIEQEETIILCVFAGDADLQTSEALKLARKVDPHGKRTIGVITKVDRIEEPSQLVPKLLQEGQHNLDIKLGMIAVRNQKPAEKAVTHEHITSLEKIFFERLSKESRQIPENTWGIVSLAKRLCDLQAQNLDVCLPGVRDALKWKVKSAQEELEHLQVPGTPLESFRLLRSNFDEVLRLLKELLKNNYDTLLEKGVNKKDAQAYHVYPRIEEVNQDLKRRLLGAAPKVFEKEAEEEIRTQLKNVGGRHLPNFLSPEVFDALMKTWFRPYKELITQASEKQIECIDDVVKRCAKLVARKEFFAILRNAIQEVLAEQYGQLEHDTEKILEKEADIVHTQNDYYTVTLRKLQKALAKNTEMLPAEEDSDAEDHRAVSASAAEDNQGAGDDAEGHDAWDHLADGQQDGMIPARTWLGKKLRVKPQGAKRLQARCESHDPKDMQVLDLQLSAFCYDKVRRKRICDDLMKNARHYLLNFLEEDPGQTIRAALDSIPQEKVHECLTKQSVQQKQRRQELEAKISEYSSLLEKIDEAGGTAVAAFDTQEWRDWKDRKKRKNSEVSPAPKERVQVEDRAVAAALDDARRTASTLYSELVEADLEAPGKIVSFVNARLHPRLANTTLLWADGVSFTEAVQRSGVPVGGEGVLVRTFRRLDELMREVAFISRHLLGLVDLAQAIQAKREETRRGVLVVPSLYLGEAEDPVAEPIPPSAPLRDCPFASGEVVSLSPLDIGFSHNTCSERFRDTQVSLLTTARSLLFGWVSWAQLPSVRVFWHRGRFYTLANRRLAAARLWALAAEWRSGDAVLVQVRVASEADARRWGWERKFTTGFTQGRSVRISGTHRRVGSSRETTTFGSELWENVAG